jgi:putative membrane protein
MSDPLPPLPERETLRLHQANERTLLAWIRTAIALMGFGFVVARFGLFLRELAASHGVEAVPRGVPWSLWTGVFLAAFGSVMVLGSTARYRMLSAAIERREVGRPRGDAWIYVAAMLVVAVGLAIGALLLTSH